MWNAILHAMADARELTQQRSRTNSLAGWIALAAAILFVLYQLATQNSIGAMQPALKQELGLVDWQIGVVSAVFLCVYAVAQIPAGMLLDRYRPRLLLPPMALGVGVSAWLLSISGGFWALVAGRALMGLFAAFAFPGAGLIARRRLPARQFALAMGLIDCAFGAGAYFGDTGVAALMNVERWNSVMADFALGGAAVAFVCWLCIGTTTGRGASATEAARSRSMAESIREVASVRQVRLAAITAAALMAMLFGFGGLWDVSLQQAFGYSHDDAIFLNGWLFIGVAITPPCAGWAADRWRKRRPILLGGQILALLAILSVLIVPAAVPMWVASVTLLALGLGIGTCVLTFPIACDAVAPANAGAALGLVNAAGLMSSAVFQVVPGLILLVAGNHSLLIMRLTMAMFVVLIIIGAVATWRMAPCSQTPR